MAAPVCGEPSATSAGGRMTEPNGREEPRSRRIGLIALFALVIAILLAAGGIFIRLHVETALAKQTDAVAIPAVAVITPRPDDTQQALVLPGDVEAWFQAPIYAQVSGYLHMWYKDIGARVKAGDLLGDIATPSIDQELRHAQAVLGQTIAAERLSQVTATRWQVLLKANAVSQQSTDVATADWSVKRAAVAAAQADLGRLEALEGFKRLIAPFDGVVTARRTDVGALIRANDVPGPELFSVADIHAMRVYVKVPQAYGSQIYVGLPADLHLPEYPDRAFPARLITTAHGIDLQSRTQLVELEAPNPDGILSPGSFANVSFRLPADRKALFLPTSALIFQENGMQVASVDGQNKVHLHAIKIARDFGTRVEVVAGLTPSMEVIDQPPDDLVEGERVRVTEHHLAPPAGAPAANTPTPGS